MLGGILAAGDGKDFPVGPIPTDEDIAPLQIKKIVTPGEPASIWYNC
jgi:hypothetical protein